MSFIKHVINNLMILLMILAGCSKKENTSKDLIVTYKVVDLAISSGAPNRALTNNKENTVGFSPDDSESRLLLQFPEINKLYDPELIQSGITSIIITLFTDDLKANPENITLHPIKIPWSVYATWNSRFGPLKTYLWDEPGGDIVKELAPFIPNIRKVSAEGRQDFFGLSFDISDYMFEKLANKDPLYGFMLRVAKSNLNSENGLSIVSFNNPIKDLRPYASMQFSPPPIENNQ